MTLYFKAPSVVYQEKRHALDLYMGFPNGKAVTSIPENPISKDDFAFLALTQAKAVQYSEFLQDQNILQITKPEYEAALPVEELGGLP